MMTLIVSIVDNVYLQKNHTMEPLKSHLKTTQNIFQNIQKKYKNFLLTLLAIGSLNVAHAQHKPLDPTSNMSFSDASPWEYQDVYLDSLLSSFESNDSSQDSLRQIIEKYLPSDIEKGMILCSSEKRAELLEETFPEEDHRLQKKTYLHFRDTTLGMEREERETSSVSLVSLSPNTQLDMKYNYLFYYDKESNLIGYCPDPQFSSKNKISTRKLKNNMIAVIIEDEEGTTSLYTGDITEARTGDLGFIYLDNWKECYPAGVEWYEDKQKFILKNTFNKERISTDDLETILLKIGSEKGVSCEKIHYLINENREVMSQPMIK